MLGRVMAAIGDAEGQIGGVDIVHASKGAVTRDITVYARDEDHGEAIRAALVSSPVRVGSVNDRVFLSHQGGVVGMQNRAPSPAATTSRWPTPRGSRASAWRSITTSTRPGTTPSRATA